MILNNNKDDLYVVIDKNSKKLYYYDFYLSAKDAKLAIRNRYLAHNGLAVAKIKDIIIDDKIYFVGRNGKWVEGEVT